MIPTNSLHEFLRSRRSVRRFTQDAVPDAAIQRILATATFAPSAHNRQPWRFFVLVDPSLKSRLAIAMAAEFRTDLEQDGLSAEQVEQQVTRSISRIESAPAIIVVCMDSASIDALPDPKRQLAERTMAIQSVAAAGAQLLLAAHAEGLGGVWVCSPLFAPQAVRAALGLESSLEPQAMFFLGSIQSNPKPRERKPLADVTRRL